LEYEEEGPAQSCNFFSPMQFIAKPLGNPENAMFHIDMLDFYFHMWTEEKIAAYSIF